MHQPTPEIIPDATSPPVSGPADATGSTGQPQLSTRDHEESALPEGSREVVALISRVRSREPGLFSDSATLSDAVATSPPTIGRFEVIRELGRGGFGVVLLARDPNLNRHVALKVPHPDVVLSPELSDRFLREGRAAAALKHPNIVPVYEAAAVGPISYLVSAYCDGPSLAAWLHDQPRPIDPQLAARLLRGMAQAVQHAHERGIVHRDLKPGNVLLDEERNETGSVLIPLITDFGMARVLEDASEPTLTGAALGTPAYMSPEQAAGRRIEIGPRTDVYALGAMLYEMLTGRRPFEADSTLATLHAIQYEPLTPPRGRVTSIPDELNDICVRCLARDPRERFETASELARRLDGFLAGDPGGIDSRRKTVEPSSAAPGKRRSKGFVTAALAAVVISLVALAFRSPEPDAPRIVPAAPAAVADVLSPRPVSHVPDSADRRVTDWVLEHGAHVNGGGRWIRSVEDVPDEPFTLLYVNVAYMKTIDEARFEDLLALNDCNTYFFALAPLEDAQLERLARPGIISLHLDQTAVTNQGLRHVRSFPDLSKLHVAGRHYTDELLETAGDWPDLTALLLISTQVTNDGLAVVGEMTTLTELSLRGGTGFDDNGLGRLSRLTRLASLDLRGTRVTDAGVFDFRTQLPGCAIVWDSPDSDVQAAFSVLNAGGRLRLATDGPSIPAESPADFPARPFTVREIDLRDSTRITDEALESIRQIRDLETLHLPAIGHTDTGLSFLTEIASLKRLILHDIVPDEATIAGLCRVDQLEILEFRGAELSDEERALLEEAIPGCHVIVTSDVPHLNSSDARRPAGTESATIAVGS